MAASSPLSITITFVSTLVLLDISTPIIHARNAMSLDATNVREELINVKNVHLALS
jgi:hypothetical protein